MSDTLSVESDMSTDKDEHKAKLFHSVLGSFFYYQDEKGGTLNLCEILLLLKNSLDSNLEIQKEISHNLKELLKKNNS